MRASRYFGRQATQRGAAPGVREQGASLPEFDHALLSPTGGHPARGGSASLVALPAEKDDGQHDGDRARPQHREDEHLLKAKVEERQHDSLRGLYQGESIPSADDGSSTRRRGGVPLPKGGEKSQVGSRGVRLGPSIGAHPAPKGGHRLTPFGGRPKPFPRYLLRRRSRHRGSRIAHHSP